MLAIQSSAASSLLFLQFIPHSFNKLADVLAHLCSRSFENIKRPEFHIKKSHWKNTQRIKSRLKSWWPKFHNYCEKWAFWLLSVYHFKCVDFVGAWTTATIWWRSWRELKQTELDFSLSHQSVVNCAIDIFCIRFHSRRLELSCSNNLNINSWGAWREFWIVFCPAVVIVVIFLMEEENEGVETELFVCLLGDIIIGLSGVNRYRVVCSKGYWQKEEELTNYFADYPFFW